MNVIDEKTINDAAGLLLRAAPGSKVILFGSYARGEARPDSDLDFLVVEPNVRNRLREMVRLTDVLRPLMLPVDVLVVSAASFDHWKDTPGTLAREATRKGRIYERVA